MTETQINHVDNPLTDYVEFDGKSGGYWMPQELADRLKVWEVREGGVVRYEVREKRVSDADSARVRGHHGSGDPGARG